MRAGVGRRVGGVIVAVIIAVAYVILVLTVGIMITEVDPRIVAGGELALKEAGRPGLGRRKLDNRCSVPRLVPSFIEPTAFKV